MTANVKIQALIYDSALTVQNGGESNLDSGTDATLIYRPVLGERTSTEAMVAWGEKGTTPGAEEWTWYQTFDTSASEGSINKQFKVLPVGHPFSTQQGMCMPVVVDSTGQSVQRTTHVLNLEKRPLSQLSAGSSALLEITLVENITVQGADPGRVVTTDDGFAFALPVVTEGLINNFIYEPGESIMLYQFQQRSESEALAAVRTASLGGLTYVPGGRVYEVQRHVVHELGFAFYPRIYSIANVGSGSALTSGETYQYKAIFEWRAANGKVHRSAPSDALSHTGAGEDVDVLVSALEITAKGMQPVAAYTMDAPTVRIYRTLGNGSFYHEVTPASGPPVGNPGEGNVTFRDQVTDSNLSTGLVLYTHYGNELPNQSPPACRYLAAGKDRLFCAGLFREHVVTASKPLQKRLGLAFAADDGVSFEVEVHEPITAIHYMDGALIAFSRDRIWLVDDTNGPDGTGAGAFGTPQEVPSDVGCTEHRSLLEVPEGLIFQSARGLYLLPRGFGAPRYIGASVQSELDTYPIVASAVLTASSQEHLARFSIVDADPATDGRVLVYDLRSGQWSVDNLGEPYLHLADDLGLLLALAGTSSPTTALKRQTTSYAEPSSDFIESTIETGDLRLNGMLGEAILKEVHVLGEYRANCKIKVEISNDSGQSWTQVGTDKSLDSGAGLSPGDPVRKAFAVPSSVDASDSHRIRVSDLELSSSSPSEGFVMHGLSVLFEPLAGLQRRPAADRG